MPSTVSLLKKLRVAYPQLSFRPGNHFQWDSTTQTITYPKVSQEDAWSSHLLHEVAHAVLGHHSYDRDVELIAIERDAWSHARSHLADQYNVTIDTQTIETAMDSYRDWLHERSICPKCTASGIEIAKHKYACVACRAEWQVNEARLCGLRRTAIKK